MNVPLLWLWKMRYWGWIVGAATASPLPPLATVMFLGLIVHLGYDLVRGNEPPRALLPEGGSKRGRLERRDEMDQPAEAAPRKAEVAQQRAGVAERLARVDGGELPAREAPRAQVRLRDLGGFDNVWVVGPKGSGKTTVLRALIALRPGGHVALDPHNYPGKWPCKVVGGGRKYAAINAALAAQVEVMSRRYEAMERGELTEADCRAAPRTLVGDEWMSIAEALPGRPATRGEEAEPGAPTRLFEILTEGRKAGAWILAASHADTATAMGLLGKKAVLLCFDRVIYLGAMAVERHPEAAAMARPAVVLDPERGSYQLLDTSEAPALAASARAPEPEPAAERRPSPEPELPPLDLSDLLDDVSAYGPPALRPLTEDEQQRLVLARRLAPKVGKTQAIRSAFDNPTGPNYSRYAADPSWRAN